MFTYFKFHFLFLVSVSFLDVLFQNFTTLQNLFANLRKMFVFNFCSCVSINVHILKKIAFAKCLGISKIVPAFQICSQIYKMFIFPNIFHNLKNVHKFHEFVWEFEKVFLFQNLFENFKKCSYL